MKNAMKKLMSVLLVAVLLISAVPFAASATVIDGEEGIDTQSASTGNKEFTYEVNFDDGRESVSKTTVAAVGTYAADLLSQVITDADAVNAKYDVSYSENVSATTEKIVVTCKVKWFDVTVRINATGLTNTKAMSYGTELKLDSSLVEQFGLFIPAGQKIEKFSESGNTYTVKGGATITVFTEDVNNAGVDSTESTTPSTPATTASYVDVILVTNKTTGFVDGEYYRCYLVDGKISTADRNVIANKISGKNIVAWKRADNGTQASTLLDFDFSKLENPINILPVVGATTNSGSNNSNNTTNGTVSSKKDLNDIILNIFVNKDFNNCKTIKLNGYSILDDDKITLNEIMNSVVTTYYKATDSNKGLQGDGLYYTTGSFMYNWLTDAKKVDPIDDIAAKRAEGTVTINIMVTNATAKSTTTTADSSNPKTGDSIYTAMTVMGISAATLAAVMYVYTKKRQAI